MHLPSPCSVLWEDRTMSDPYLDDLEFANKANIEVARKFKAERDALEKEREYLMRSTFEAAIEQCAKIAENYGETLSNPVTVSNCRTGIAKAIRSLGAKP